MTVVGTSQKIFDEAVTVVGERLECFCRGLSSKIHLAVDGGGLLMRGSSLAVRSVATRS